MTVPSQIHVLRRHRTVGRFSQFLLVAVVVTAIGIGYWARNLRFTAVAEGQGVIRPVGKSVWVTSEAGGIVAPHRIQEGMTVNKGQLLFSVETATEIAVSRKALPVPRALRAMIARLEAESGGSESIVFPAGLAGSAEAERARARFDQRRSKLNRRILALQDSVRQARLETVERKATADRAARARELARKELDVLGPLVDRGISPKLEFLRVQQRVQDLDGQHEKALLAVPRLEAVARDAERKVVETTADFQSEAKRLLAEKKREAAAVPRETASKNRKITTTIVRAPFSGSIRRVLVGNAGMTVGAGQTLAILALPVKNLIIDGKVPAYAAENLLPKEDVLVEYGYGADIVRVDAEFPVIAPNEDQSKGPDGVRRVTLRVDVERPGFNTLAKNGGQVRIAVKYQKPILSYLLDRLGLASGGRILERLAGR